MFKLPQYDPFLNITITSSSNYRVSVDIKSPINPSSRNKSYIHVIVDAFSLFVVTVPINLTMLTLMLNYFFTIGLSILLDLFTFLLIVDQNTPILIWQNYVLLRVFVTLLEFFIPLGQMDSLKFETRTFVCPFKTLQKINTSQPLSSSNVCPCEIDFHTRSRIPLSIDM